jgi:hypothetical protein
MLAFVDASGDPGRQILNRSSRYFILALVTLDEQHASDCDRRITGLRDTLGLPSDFEFHFSDNSARIRHEFLKEVSSCEFSYHTYALDKDPDVLKRLQLDRKEEMFTYVISQVCQRAALYLENAKVVIDGQRSDRGFRDRLATSLRREVRTREGRGLVRSVSVQPSRQNNLLQLADYAAGVQNRMLCERPDGAELHRYLVSHELTSQVWPQM